MTLEDLDSHATKGKQLDDEMVMRLGAVSVKEVNRSNENTKKK